MVGIISWVTYIALNIESAILGAFQNAITRRGQEFQGTWVGKIFGLGDKLANLIWAQKKVKNEATFYKSSRPTRASRIWDRCCVMALTDAIDTAQTVALNSADRVSSLYGDIGLISRLHSMRLSVT